MSRKALAAGSLLKANSTAALEAATAELELKQQRLNTLAEINRTGGESRDEFSRAKADAELARAKPKLAEEMLASDRLEVKKIEVPLQRRMIRSPIDGVVAAARWRS